ncbi:hypothetical protein MPH_00451 [Macrophomina phaseolina MS6]|uniref:Uncharacterized protein n=1 Tax=Macrophomina phaseolina (strain MS6) TaxID=1126212 RepID=K2SBG4_MACPH|nr:hypothetical protein MPH_00451 [Macrophomina phaseolina MS6]
MESAASCSKLAFKVNVTLMHGLQLSVRHSPSALCNSLLSRARYKQFADASGLNRLSLVNSHNTAQSPAWHSIPGNSHRSPLLVARSRNIRAHDSSRGQRRGSLLTTVVSDLRLNGRTRQMWGPWQATCLSRVPATVYQMRCPSIEIRASQKLQTNRFEPSRQRGSKMKRSLPIPSLNRLGNRIHWTPCGHSITPINFCLSLFHSSTWTVHFACYNISYLSKPSVELWQPRVSSTCASGLLIVRMSAPAISSLPCPWCSADAGLCARIGQSSRRSSPLLTLCCRTIKRSEMRQWLRERRFPFFAELRKSKRLAESSISAVEYSRQMISLFTHFRDTPRYVRIYSWATGKRHLHASEYRRFTSVRLLSSLHWPAEATAEGHLMHRPTLC